MIYTLTMNPAIDYRMNVPEIISGITNRAFSEELSFGGKGINVSFVLKELGIQSKALGICAGFTGKALLQHLDNSGIAHDFLFLEGNRNTRINIKLATGCDKETEINAAGPQLLEKETELLIEKIKSNVKSGDTLILSGSVPKGTDSNIYARIMKELSGRNIRFAVDASGDLLKNTLSLSPFLIKPNNDELSALMGKTLDTKEELVNAARTLQCSGAQNVLVSMGGQGALLLDETGKTSFVCAHTGKAVNTVGAGDSMVAGFVAGYSQGYEYALKLGNACGAATAFSNSLASKQDIFKYM